MKSTTRWGIIGTGGIARKFANAAPGVEGAELVAIGSRTREKAEAFGDEFKVAHRYGSYEALASDDRLDAVYIATPHPMHHPNSLLCLRAGKAVLCEKPFTVNASQAAEVIDAARENKLFCMEAMWTRFLPTLVKTRQILAAGTIGEVRMVLADFAFRAAWNPERRLLNPELAGGGLLDVGVYCVSLASMVLGSPSRVAGLAHIGETGVDEHSAVVLGYDEGQLAVLVSGVRTSTLHEAVIIGTAGRLRLESPWWHGTKLTVATGEKEDTLELPFKGNGFDHEIEEVGRCLAAGKLESEIMPLDETLSIMKTMDTIRAQWHLRYPME
ncbi:MAG: Gfo/Idh/MocA family protein [Planctomycetota bacterium]